MVSTFNRLHVDSCGILKKYYLSANKDHVEEFDEFLNVIIIYGVGDDKQSNLKRINMIKFTVPKCYVTQVRRGLYGPYSLLKCKNMVMKRALIFFLSNLMVSMLY